MRSVAWVRHLQERPRQAEITHELRAGSGTPRIQRLGGALDAGSHHHVVAAEEYLLNIVR
jgi:hypothetical protein